MPLTWPSNPVVGQQANGREWDGTSWRVPASSSSADGVPWVFYNPLDAYGSSWYHGDFWPDPATNNQGRFFWEAWVCPMGGSGGSGQYWISEGYGGGHTVLCSPANGNIWNGQTSSATSWTADYTPEDGEWVHSACSWDGTNVRHYTNGVVVAEVAFAGPRNGASDAQGGLYLAGSDHSNLHGKLAAVRGWETGSTSVSPIPYNDLANGLQWPFAPDRSFVPFVSKNIARPMAQFCADFTKPGQIVTDHGIGFPEGTLHHGGKIGGSYFILDRAATSGYFVRDPTCPLRADQAVIPTRTLPTAPSTPVGAKVFDSFSRANSLLCWTATPTLGTTEAGSLGAKTWQYAVANSWGVLAGRAVFQGTYWGAAWVASDSADMDVRVDRRAVSGLSNTGLCARVQDASNYLSVYAEGSLTAPTVRLQKGGAGTFTTIASAASVPTSWTTLRLVCSGSNLSVYCDATQVISATDSTYSSATGAGIFSHYPPSTARRWDNFTVI